VSCTRVPSIASVPPPALAVPYGGDHWAAVRFAGRPMPSNSSVAGRSRTEPGSMTAVVPPGVPAANWTAVSSVKIDAPAVAVTAAPSAAAAKAAVVARMPRRRRMRLPRSVGRCSVLQPTCARRCVLRADGPETDTRAAMVAARVWIDLLRGGRAADGSPQPDPGCYVSAWPGEWSSPWSSSGRCRRHRSR
jgi:hypothetical protein